MFTTHIVTSRDGVKFSIQFESASAACAEVTKTIEENFASRRSAAELDKIGTEYGYHRIPLQELPPMKLFAQTSAFAALIFLALFAPIVLMGYGN